MSEKKVVFVVETIGSETAVKKLASVELAMKQIRDEMKKAKASGDQEAFARLSVEMEKLKVTATGLKQEIRAQNKEFEISKYPTDSLRALEHQYAKVSKQIRDMTEAQRESAGGQTLINTAKSLKDKINETSMAFGDTTKNIGNYTKSIQKALENPLKFIKNAGIVGIVATIGVKLFDMGKAAVDAFGKTEEGAKKLKGVQLGFERIKEVAKSFAFSIIESMLPFVERVLPFVTKGLIILTSHFKGVQAVALALGSNIVNAFTRLGNSIEIIGLKAKNFVGLGDDESKQRVKDLQAENEKLKAGVIDLGSAYTDAFKAQYKAGTQAADNAKLQKKEAKDQITALEQLKKQEEAIRKTIEDRAAKGQDISKELQIQEGLLQKIKAVEDSIALATAKTLKQRMAIKEASLNAVLENNDVDSEPYKKAAFELAKLRLEQLKLQEQEEEAAHAAEIRAKGVVQNTIAELDKLPKTVVVEVEPVLNKNNQDITDDKERIRANKSVSDAQNKINEDNRNKELKRIEEIKEAKRQALRDTANEAIDFGANLLSQQVEQERAQVEKQRDTKLAALNDEYDKKKAFAAGNNELLVKLEAERVSKEEKINKEAAKKQQALAIKQAIINAAAAAVKTLANLGIPAGLIALIPLAAATAAQIALIKSQKFAKGGYTDQKFLSGGYTGMGRQVDETGERVAGIGVYHGGEYIAPRKQVLRYPSLFQWLDKNRDKNLDWSMAPPAVQYMFKPDRLKMYAEGGFTTPSISPAIRQAAGIQTQEVKISDDQMIFFARTVAVNTAREVREATAKGIGDANRRLEREERLQEKLSK